MGRLKGVNGMDFERLFADELASQIDREILKKLWEFTWTEHNNTVNWEFTLNEKPKVEDDDSQFEFGFE